MFRQVDDLQFQLEEQGVISGDQLETATETSAQSLTKLTEELQEERRIMQQLRNQLKVYTVLNLIRSGKGILVLCTAV